MSLPSIEHLPFILLTAKCMELDVAKLRQRLRMAAALPKPFSPNELLTCIEECLAVASRLVRWYVGRKRLDQRQRPTTDAHRSPNQRNGIRMFARSFHIQLPRRVTAYFLLFGLTAVVWLSAGAFYVARAVSQTPLRERVLAMVGPRREPPLARLPATRRRPTCRRCVHEIDHPKRRRLLRHRVADGRLLAHTMRRADWPTAPDRSGTDEQWGDAARVHYVGR